MQNKTKPKCNKGYPCGYACINQNLACRGEVSKENATALLKAIAYKRSIGKGKGLDQLEALAMAKQAEGNVTQANGKIVQITDGKVDIDYKSLDAKLADYKVYRSKAVEMLADMFGNKDRPDDEYNAMRLELNKIKSQRDTLEKELLMEMSRIKDSLYLTGMSRKDADDAANRIPFFGFEDEKLLRSHVSNFYRITNGAGADKVSLIKAIDPGRSSANLDTGIISMGAKDRSTMYHELAHLAEDLDTIRSNNAFIARRSTDGELYRLSVLTGDDRFNDDEVAVSDSFISHYVGKYYGRPSDFVNKAPGWDDIATEVLSKGLELFDTAKHMLTLYETDSEHFKITMDFLNKQRGRK